MKESRSWLTPKEAALLVGCTTRTINNYIVSGKLPATKDDKRYYIAKSEFFRIFPQYMPKEKVSESGKGQEKTDGSTSEIEVQYLKEALLDKEKQNDFLQNLIQSYTVEKSMMLQTINSHTKMLEFSHEKEAAKLKKSWLEYLKIWKKS
jgi:excisionase family DNA binding protein